MTLNWWHGSKGWNATYFITHKSQMKNTHTQKRGGKPEEPALAMDLNAMNFWTNRTLEWKYEYPLMNSSISSFEGRSVTTGWDFEAPLGTQAIAEIICCCAGSAGEEQSS